MVSGKYKHTRTGKILICFRDDCNNKFYCKPSHAKRRKYCSHSCRAKDNIRWKHKEETKIKISETNKLNPVHYEPKKLTGHKDSFLLRLRHSAKWKIWREAVFLRDNFTCKNFCCKYCNNKVGVILHPHHIKPVALYPELMFHIDNGVTYCAEFHLKSGLHRDIKKSLMQKEI